jgi:4-alpha-glucanotransferase
MESENYAWWKNRFRKMADYFDAYRIDHILGFFRIWEIPLDVVQGLLGYFSPALPYWAEEIENAGIPFDSERLTKPFIHEDFLPELFGAYTDEVKTTYLSKLNDKQFKLNLFCDTQQKIKHLFDGKMDEKNVQIYNGLLTLCSEVLFIRDRYDPNRFHPRITAQNTYSFRYLDEQAQQNFIHLYNEFFYHRHNYFWHEQAMKKLPALISSTSMLVCGEDLGMIPDCVPPVMDELQILSLEIERMPKNPQIRFTDLRNLPYLSVCTTSTHDMSPIRLWWTENRELTQRYYNEILHHEGEAPEECSAELCVEILKNHLNSPAMWVVLPWQDWLSIDERLRNPNIEMERINIPANPEHYWRYRMYISLDDLLVENELNERVREMSERR